MHFCLRLINLYQAALFWQSIVPGYMYQDRCARLAHAHIARYLGSHSLPARSFASLVLLLWAVKNKNAVFAIPYLRPSFQLQYYGSTRMLEWMSQKSRKIILTAFRLCGGADSGPLIRASLAFPLH